MMSDQGRQGRMTAPMNGAPFDTAPASLCSKEAGMQELLGADCVSRPSPELTFSLHDLWAESDVIQLRLRRG